MSALSFQQLVSKIASRMRHDLKGGLVTLKMGLESLGDEEPLKPLLLDKAQEMVDLSDKLILLLRMGETKKCSVALSGLLGHLTREITTRYPKLRFTSSNPESESRLFLDPDAFAYAASELAQNSGLAGADHFQLRVVEGDQEVAFIFTDNGPRGDGPRPLSLEKSLEFGCSGWGRSGLGLSIVQGFASAHSGQMKVADDEGWSVTLLVPRTEGEAESG